MWTGFGGSLAVKLEWTWQPGGTFLLFCLVESCDEYPLEMEIQNKREPDSQPTSAEGCVLGDTVFIRSSNKFIYVDEIAVLGKNGEEIFLFVICYSYIGSSMKFGYN